MVVGFTLSSYENNINIMFPTYSIGLYETPFLSQGAMHYARPPVLESMAASRWARTGTVPSTVRGSLYHVKAAHSFEDNNPPQAGMVVVSQENNHHRTGWMIHWMKSYSGTKTPMPT
jgi:hypothetical protein